jgi:hypothetical protein
VTGLFFREFRAAANVRRFRHFFLIFKRLTPPP